MRDFDFYYGIEEIKNNIISAIRKSPEKTPIIYHECAQRLAYYQAEYLIGIYKEEATQGMQKILFILKNIRPLNFKLHGRINIMYEETVRRVQEYGNTRKQENN